MAYYEPDVVFYVFSKYGQNRVEYILLLFVKAILRRLDNEANCVQFLFFK